VDRFLEHDGCDVADSYLRFSPDGSRVVFQREGTEGMALFTAALDGEAELQLTEWGFGARPDWSRDGEWIVLMDTNTCDCPALQDIDLYRVRPDGSDLTQLTDPGDDGTFDAYPRWLPDGSGIIFSRCTTGGLVCDTRTIAADGSSDVLLVPGLGRGEVHAVMQPPG
jgi:Tol biopolymer transport system component